MSIGSWLPSAARSHLFPRELEDYGVVGVGAAGVGDLGILFPGQGAAELEGGDEGEKDLMGPDAEIRPLLSCLEAVPYL